MRIHFWLVNSLLSLMISANDRASVVWVIKNNNLWGKPLLQWSGQITSIHIHVFPFHVSWVQLFYIEYCFYEDATCRLVSCFIFLWLHFEFVLCSYPRACDFLLCFLSEWSCSCFYKIIWWKKRVLTNLYSARWDFFRILSLTRSKNVI